MVLKCDSSVSVLTFEKALLEVAAASDVGFILVLTCEANGFVESDLDPVLQRCTKPLLGGIFPQIIFGNTRQETGFIIAGFTAEAKIRTISGLSSEETDFEAELESIGADVANSKTHLMFVDGLACRINAFVDELFAVFGLEANYIGGGAGSLSFEKMPCLLSNSGLLQDAAIIAFTELDMGIGVSHGWKDLAGPFEVTETVGNAIVSLDWRPAREVYQEAVTQHSGTSFEGKSFFEVAKGYPFGISRLGTEKVVRDPIGLARENAIVCVGEVPNHAFVHILEGEPDSLISAADEALKRAKDDSPGEMSNKGILLIDCISRYLFLGDQFSAEFSALTRHAGEVPVFGALTLGEIANNRKDYLEFLNKTAVVGVFDV